MTALLVAPTDLGSDGRTPIATLIGADFSALSITPSDAARAPAVVRSALDRFAPYDARARRDLSAHCILDMGDADAAEQNWVGAFSRIHEHAVSAFEQERFVISLGGDHSVSWPLITAAAERHGRIGVIQLDAHHDLRSLDAGPSNGTPFRGLIDRGTINGSDIVQIGINRAANQRESSEYAVEQGVSVVGVWDLHGRRCRELVHECLERLAATDAIYLSCDIDVLDRAYAPGTVAALPGGIDPPLLFELVELVCSDPRCIAMDVVEFAPGRDVESVTAYAAAGTVWHAVTGVASR